MPKQSMQHIIGRLNEMVGDQHDSSVQEDALRQLKHFMHGWDEEVPQAPTLLGACELLHEEWQDTHPQLAGMLKEVIRHLADMGV